MSLSNYPPGVTGNEPQIAGYPECNCEEECDGYCKCEGGDCESPCWRCLEDYHADLQRGRMKDEM